MTPVQVLVHDTCAGTGTSYSCLLCMQKPGCSSHDFTIKNLIIREE